MPYAKPCFHHKGSLSTAVLNSYWYGTYLDPAYLIRLGIPVRTSTHAKIITKHKDTRAPTVDRMPIVLESSLSPKEISLKFHIYLSRSNRDAAKGGLGLSFSRLCLFRCSKHFGLYTNEI